MFSINRQNMHLAALAICCFIVYVICMPKVVSLEDSGLFNMVCATAGIGHPPGYPLYSLLCYPFANLPFISTPVGVSIFSALCAALACLVLAKIIALLLPVDANAHSSNAYSSNRYNLSTNHGQQRSSAPSSNLTILWIAGFALAFSEAFWSQAIIQEVYSLNTLLILLSYYFAIGYYQQGQRHNHHPQRQQQQQADQPLEIDDEEPDSASPLSNVSLPTPNFSHRYLYLCTLCVGLGLSNHWPLLLLAAPGLLFLILPNWRLFTPRLLVILPAIMIVCLLPYLYLWLRSLAFTDINFYGPLDFWQRFWIYISRTGYAGVDASGSGLHRISFAWWLASQAKLQLGIIGIALFSVGYIYCWRKVGAFISLAFTWLLLSSTVVLNSLLSFSFEPTFQWVFRVYPLQSWAVLALVAALGFYVVLLWLSRQLSTITSARTANIITTGIALLILVAMPLLHWQKNYRHNDTWADDYARLLLNSFEANADLFVFDDSHLPLIYLHKIENVRPDIRIYNTQSLILGNRLFDIDTPVKFRSQIFANHIVQSQRPTYYISPLALPFGSEDNGVYRKVRLDLPAGQQLWVENRVLREQIDNLYQRLAQQSAGQYWNQRSMETAYLEPQFSLIKQPGFSPQQCELKAKEVLSNNPLSYHANHLLGVCLIMLQRHQQAVAHLEKSLSSQPRNNDPLANLINTLIFLNQKERALSILANSHKLWPSKDKKEMLELARAGNFVNQ